MLGAEAALLLLLTRRAGRWAPGDVGAFAAVMSRRMISPIAAGRRKARELGRERLDVEMALFGHRVSSTPSETMAVDLAASQRAARGYGRTLFRNYARAVKAGAAPEVAAAQAIQQSAWKLELAATTETATAFNLEREIAAREVVTGTTDLRLFRPRLFSGLEGTAAESAAARGLIDPRTGQILESEAARIAGVDRRLQAERELFRIQQRLPREQMVKQWDATLDKRTCTTCEHAHGVWIPVGQDFPEGEPGAVHPRCRCVSTFLPADWVDADMRWAA
jgi:hypothetical protein